MERNDKIVRFDIYCTTCKYKPLNEDEKPCYDCLAVPVRTSSMKPEFWEDKNGNK